MYTKRNIESWRYDRKLIENVTIGQRGLSFNWITQKDDMTVISSYKSYKHWSLNPLSSEYGFYKNIKKPSGGHCIVFKYVFRFLPIIDYETRIWKIGMVGNDIIVVFFLRKCYNIFTYILHKTIIKLIKYE